MRSQRARALLAEKGIFICGFPEHRHDEPTRGSSTAEHGPHKPDSRGSIPRPATTESDATTALPTQDESGAPVADTPVRAERLTELPPQGDLPPVPLLLAFALITDLMEAEPRTAISHERLIHVLSVVCGYCARLEAENQVLREMVESVLTVGPQARDPHR